MAAADIEESAEVAAGRFVVGEEKGVEGWRVGVRGAAAEGVSLGLICGIGAEGWVGEGGWHCWCGVVVMIVRGDIIR